MTRCSRYVTTWSMLTRSRLPTNWRQVIRNFVLNTNLLMPMFAWKKKRRAHCCCELYLFDILIFERNIPEREHIRVKKTTNVLHWNSVCDRRYFFCSKISWDWEQRVRSLSLYHTLLHDDFGSSGPMPVSLELIRLHIFFSKCAWRLCFAHSILMLRTMNYEPSIVFVLQ